MKGLEQVEIVKHAGDATSMGIVISSVAGWLPSVSAILAICWTAMRIYESVTGRRFSESYIAKLITKKKK